LSTVSTSSFICDPFKLQSLHDRPLALVVQLGESDSFVGRYLLPCLPVGRGRRLIPTLASLQRKIIHCRHDVVVLSYTPNSRCRRKCKAWQFRALEA
jgi:hypothetical protein